MPRTFLFSLVLGLGGSLWAATIAQKGSDAACLVGGSCQAVLRSPLAHVLGVPTWQLGLTYFVVVGLIGALLPAWLPRLRTLALLAAGFALFLQADALLVVHGFCPACLTACVASSLLAWSLSRALPSAREGGTTSRWLAAIACAAAIPWAFRLARPLEFNLTPSQKGLLEAFAPEPLAGQGPWFVVFSDLGCPACYAAKPSLLRMRGSGRLIFAPVAKHPGEEYVTGEYLFMECLRRNEGWLFLQRCPDPDSIAGFCQLTRSDLRTTEADLSQYRSSLIATDRLFDIIGTAQTPSVFRLEGARLVRTSLGEMLKWRRS